MIDYIRTLWLRAKAPLTVCGFPKLYTHRIPRDSLCVAICRFDSQLVQIVTAMLTPSSLGQDVSHDGNCKHGHDYSQNMDQSNILQMSMGIARGSTRRSVNGP